MSWHGINPYFDILMSKLMKAWRKKRFYLRNDVNTPLPVFTGNRPIPQPTWEYGVAKNDLIRLQPLHEVIQQLR
jgi:hypothetical protein